IKREHLLILLEHRITRLGQDPNHRLFIERLQGSNHRNTPDKLGDKPEAQQIIGGALCQQLRRGLLWHLATAPKTDRTMAAQASRDYLVDPLKRTTTDE